jgi:hypothetical protein
MFLNISQIEEALTRLKSIHPFYGIVFLVCKRENLPVGDPIPFPISTKETEFLEQYYKPNRSSEFFYRVFRTSNKEKHWVHWKKYASSTLQSIRTQTVFAKAFIHEPRSDKWGWGMNYLDVLRSNLLQNLPPYRGEKVPLFYLAVWLYREREWAIDATAKDVIDTFIKEFHISELEKENIFEVSVPISLYPNLLFQETMVTWEDLREIIGLPPDAKPEEGAALRFLELREIGPAAIFRYEPADRLNIITGDNSLGKTFILETIWWALTGQWLEYPALPCKNVPKKKPRIAFSISTDGRRSQTFSADYNWDKQKWRAIAKREALPGLVIYARFDGSFAVWDPARTFLADEEGRARKGPAHLFFKRRDIWNGLSTKDEYQREQWLCNGLIRDWVTWQLGGDRYKEYYDALVACLKALSPSGVESLTPGEPMKLSIEDARDFPTLRMPYGDVPVVHASAGVQRIVALAYILVWTWYEHLRNSSVIRRRPQRRLVLMIDEVEAHLHPRWQRIIVPALMEVISELSSSISPQIHMATHSPMIMASAETVFNEQTDDLHHLKLVGHDVVLEELPFIKRGRADLWLMSDVFGLEHARSLPAEQAIEDAKALQLVDSPTPEAVREVNARLVKYLAQDDDFWPRWRYFAKQYGVDG